ncbi:MAG: hypothetical protein J6B98_03900 [Bacilli bacterium]|nr:hypothetical protein [Bacilli bacterium]
MKKFNLLRASSLILSSYFIIGFSSCSKLKQSNNIAMQNHYEEIDFNTLLFQKLNIDEYLNNSEKLQIIVENFRKKYNDEALYIFGLPITYKEYKLFIYDGTDYVNIGYISKNGNDLVIEYFINENGYKKIVKHTLIFNFSREIKRYYDEITYEDLKNGYSYKEYYGYSGNLSSLVYKEDKSIFEIILNNNDRNTIIFKYDLVNSVESNISEEEHDILVNSLLEKYNQKDLEMFIKENESMLFNILKRSENDSVYYEYDAIFEMLDELSLKSRVRTK